MDYDFTNLIKLLTDIIIPLSAIITLICSKPIIKLYEFAFNRGKQIFYSSRTTKLPLNFFKENSTILTKSSRNIYQTKIGIWNGKKDTISSEDIIGNKIIVSTEESHYNKILYTDIIFESNKTNQFSTEITQDKQQIEITFNHIGHNDTVILSLIHESILDSTKKISVSAPIKSGKNIEKVDFDNNQRDIDHLGNFFVSKTRLLNILHIIFLWTYFFIAVPKIQPVFNILYLACLYIYQFFIFKKKRRLPRGNNKFLE